MTPQMAQGSRQLLQALTLGACLQVTPRLAQAQANVPPGAEVRVTAPSHSRRPVVGRLQRIDQDTIWIQQADATVGIAHDQVTRLQVATGRRSNTGWGALVGVLLGAATGAAIAPSDLQDAEAVYAGIGAGGGLLLGALGGYLVKSDRWEVVPVRAASSAWGPAVSLSLRFAF